MRQTISSLFLILLLAVAGWVWFRYFRASPPAVPASSAEVSERLAQYRDLRNLRPDIGVFSDPLFRSLTSPPRPSGGPPGSPGQPPVGRQNPFAPLP